MKDYAKLPTLMPKKNRKGEGEGEGREEGKKTKEKEKRSGIITGLSYSKTAHLTLQFILPLLFQTKKADRLGHDSQLQRQTLPRILQGKK